LIGRDEFLVPLVESALKVSSAKYIGKYNVLGLEIENLASTDITLQNQTGYTLHSNNDMIVLRAGEKTTIEVKTIGRKQHVSLKFLVLSAVNAPNKHPAVTIKTKVEQTNQ
jgi:hypothetical protein